MKTARFEDLFREELEDLYDAERQIVESLPKMIAAASTVKLAEALQNHLDESREQVRRLERVFGAVGEEPVGGQCEAMRGLLHRGERLMGELEKSPVLDAGIIGTAQKADHYQIAAYASIMTLAEILGQPVVAGLLDKSLEEEKGTDEHLTEIAELILGGDAVAKKEVMEEIEKEEI
jgi:ferritin-like metal-binding protein YciE